jgi:RimJ/RimL family protein N-acetyltransferase
LYWIGISRYEEKSELFAIKADDEYVSLIGGGFDEDGITGYLNPLMIDYRYQGNGYGKQAVKLMIKYLKEKLNVIKISLGHRKENKRQSIYMNH